MALIRSESVRYAGTREAESELSWGQRSIWRSIRWLDDDDPYFNVPFTLPVDGEHPLDQVTHALRTLIERHEALRTICVETGDGPRQRIVRTGEVTVAVHDAGDEDPAACAQRVAADLAGTAFRYADELPVRCAVVLADGQPRRLALALSHLSVDAWSLGVLRDEWESLLAGATLPRVDHQPLERAAFERAAAGAARGADSLRYWRETLATVPRSLFDYPPGNPEEPRFVRVGIESTALAVAAGRLAAATGTSTASVLTVAIAAVLATFTGHPDCAMQLIVANRHDRRYRSMVGPLAQDGLLSLRFEPDESLLAAIKRGHMRTMAGYRYGHYDPAALPELRQEVGRDRGVDFDLSAFFNDVRTTGDWPDLPEVADDAALAGLSGRTRTRFVGAWHRVDAKAFFATGPATDTGELYLLADTAYLPRETAYDLLRAVEAVLVHGAVHGDPTLGALAEISGLTPVERPPDWVRIGPDRVCPSAVADVVRAAAGTGDAVVAVEQGSGDATADGAADAATDGAGGVRSADRLVAYLAPSSGTTPADVHEAVMARLVGRTDAVAPGHYVLCAAPPAAPQDLDQWRASPRVSEGSGRRTR